MYPWQYDSLEIVDVSEGAPSITSLNGASSSSTHALARPVVGSLSSATESKWHSRLVCESLLWEPLVQKRQISDCLWSLPMNDYEMMNRHFIPMLKNGHYELSCSEPWVRDGPLDRLWMQLTRGVLNPSDESGMLVDILSMYSISISDGFEDEDTGDEEEKAEQEKERERSSRTWIYVGEPISDEHQANNTASGSLKKRKIELACAESDKKQKLLSGCASDEATLPSYFSTVINHEPVVPSLVHFGVKIESRNRNRPRALHDNEPILWKWTPELKIPCDMEWRNTTIQLTKTCDLFGYAYILRPLLLLPLSSDPTNIVVSYLLPFVLEWSTFYLTLDEMYGKPVTQEEYKAASAYDDDDEVTVGETTPGKMMSPTSVDGIRVVGNNLEISTEDVLEYY
jgi:hypothetical protein